MFWHSYMETAAMAIPSLDSLGKLSRAKVIDDHGFSNETIPVAWFDSHLAAAGVPGTVRLDAPERPDRTGRISRGGLFALAEPLVQGAASDEQVLDLFWSVLCWGSDHRSRNNKQRISSFVDHSDRKRHIASLRYAAALIVKGDAKESYRALVRNGAGYEIPSLGPAFFTKWLYFVGAGDVRHRGIILDDRVARALTLIDLPEVQALRIKPGETWTSNQYLGYVTLATRWAGECEQVAQRSVGLDEVEKDLWASGG